MERSKEKRVTKATKAGLVFPVSRFQSALKKGNYADRIGTGAAVYMAAVLEYLSAEILELAGNTAGDNKKKRIKPRHIMIAVRNDSELSKLLKDVTISEAGVMPMVNPVLLPENSKQKNKNAATDVNYFQSQEI